MRALVREFTSACLTLRGCIRGCELANLPHHAALRFLFCHTQLRDDLRQVFLGHLDFDAVEQALSAGHERAHAGVGRRASQAGRAAGGEGPRSLLGPDWSPGSSRASSGREGGRPGPVACGAVVPAFARRLQRCRSESVARFARCRRDGGRALHQDVARCWRFSIVNVIGVCLRDG